MTDWDIIGIENGGRDENKRWMAPKPETPRSEQWLFKPRRMHPGERGEFTHSDVSEVIASRLAWAMGLPAADCRLASRLDDEGELILGAVSRNVAGPGFDIHSGGTHLEAIAGYRRVRRHGKADRDEGYTLDAVAAVLEGLNGPPGWGHLTACQVFAGYLVLDAWIANTDRHPRNWAMLEHVASGFSSLAPTFDHGSALGSGMNDAARCKRDVKSFCGGGKARPFEPTGSNLLGLAVEAAGRFDGKFWFDRCAEIPLADIEAIMEPCSARLSEVAYTFVHDVLIENQRRVKECLSEPPRGVSW